MFSRELSRARVDGDSLRRHNELLLRNLKGLQGALRTLLNTCRSIELVALGSDGGQRQSFLAFLETSLHIPWNVSLRAVKRCTTLLLSGGTGGLL